MMLLLDAMVGSQWLSNMAIKGFSQAIFVGLINMGSRNLSRHVRAVTFCSSSSTAGQRGEAFPCDYACPSKGPLSAWYRAFPPNWARDVFL